MLAAEVEAQDKQQGALQEVIVTAQKSEESPAGRADLRHRHSRRPDRQLCGIGIRTTCRARCPAVQFMSSGLTNTTIRGVGTYNNQPNVDAAVAWNIDGTYISHHMATPPILFDLDRIEVVRGPLGTLYGKNSNGGAINVLTAKPVLGEWKGARLGGRRQLRPARHRVHDQRADQRHAGDRGRRSQTTTPTATSKTAARARTTMPRACACCMSRTTISTSRPPGMVRRRRLGRRAVATARRGQRSAPRARASSGSRIRASACPATIAQRHGRPDRRESRLHGTRTNWSAYVEVNYRLGRGHADLDLELAQVRSRRAPCLGLQLLLADPRELVHHAGVSAGERGGLAVRLGRRRCSTRRKTATASSSSAPSGRRTTRFRQAANSYGVRERQGHDRRGVRRSHLSAQRSVPREGWPALHR